MPARDSRIGVLHVVHSLNIGGAEKLVHDLALATDGDAFRVEIACLDGLGALAAGLAVRGYKLHPLERRPGLDTLLPLRIAELCRRRALSVVHAHQYTPFFYGVLGARLSARARCLFTEHGRHHPDVRKPKRVAANAVLARLCDEVVAVSEFTRRALIENDGFPSEKVRVLYNGVHLSDPGVGPDRATVRAALGLQPTDRVVGLCARLSPEKNVPLLVEAFASLRAAVPEARLVIAGDGPARPEIEASVRRLGLEADVALLGFRDDVPALMRAFDVFCLPSLTEGTSITLLEAMNAACPAVVTRVGGNPEIVVDGVTGDCVPSGDATALAAALTAMLQDGDRARRMGAAGRARVKERFTFEGMVLGYEALYRRLGASRRFGHLGST